MAFTKMLKNYSVTLFILQVILILAKGFELKLEPKTLDDLHPQDVSILCQPLNLKSRPRQILLLEISRQSQKLASIDNNNHIIKATGGSSSDSSGVSDLKHEVKGHLENQGGPNFLKVAIFNQTANVSVKYDCDVVYKDFEGQVRQERASAELMMIEPSIEMVNSVVKVLIEKVSRLENDRDRLEREAATDRKKIQNLEAEISNRNETSDLNIAYELKKKLENQQNLTKINEEKVEDLKLMLQRQTKANKDIKDNLEEMRKEQNNRMKLHEKSHEKLLIRIINLEKISNDQDVKIMTLKYTDVDVKQELKKLKTQIDEHVSKSVSRISMKNVTDELLAKLQNSTRFVSKKEFEVESNEKSKDIKTIKANENIMVSMVNRVANRVNHLELLKYVQNNITTDLKNKMDLEIKSFEDKLNTTKKTLQKDDGVISELKKTVEKFDSRLKNVEISKMNDANEALKFEQEMKAFIMKVNEIENGRERLAKQFQQLNSEVGVMGKTFSQRFSSLQSSINKLINDNKNNKFNGHNG